MAPSIIDEKKDGLSWWSKKTNINIILTNLLQKYVKVHKTNICINIEQFSIRTSLVAFIFVKDGKKNLT